MSELDLFSFVLPKFKIDKPVRLIELFAGIGSQAKSLERLCVDFEHWRAVEFDKYAMASYNAVHGTDFDVSDITKIHASDLGIAERERFLYIMTYSFPCQDLSIAGNQKGMAKGSGTRSGLLWEVERLLDELDGNLPQVLLMENVPQVIGKKNIGDFQKWRAKLESLGYSCYVQLLNAKDYGIPQNRNRCFMVSLLGEYHYEFPEKKKLVRKLKDLLEDNVDDKYYLPQDVLRKFIEDSDRQKAKGNGFRFEPMPRETERAKAITTKPGQRKCDNFINEDDVDYHDCVALDEQNGYFRQDGCIGTPTTDGSSPKHNNRIVVPANNSKGFDVAMGGDTINLSLPKSKTRRGRVGHGVAQTLQTSMEQVVIEDEQN